MMITKKAYRMMIGNRISFYMKRKGITRLELAEAINVPKSSLSAYIRGDRIPSIKAAVNMCRYFRITMDDLANFGCMINLSRGDD